ncbi:MAG: hypothetical protein HQK52_23575 [Oligoflexia bacterium]|nr:hypothetical protein [Oligoflexia bacterium]
MELNAEKFKKLLTLAQSDNDAEAISVGDISRRRIVMIYGDSAMAIFNYIDGILLAKNIVSIQRVLDKKEHSVYQMESILVFS